MAKTAAERMRESRAKRRKAPPAIKCARCGVAFAPKRSTAVYCSAECRKASHKEKVGTALTVAAEARRNEVAAFSVAWEGLDKLAVADIVAQLADVKGYPLLTRDGYWLEDARITTIDNRMGGVKTDDNQLRSIHVTVNDAYYNFHTGQGSAALNAWWAAHRKAYWIQGRGYVNAREGNPRLMVQVLVEVAASPEIAYERARQWLIDQGGEKISSRDQSARLTDNFWGSRLEYAPCDDHRMVPMPWEYRHMPWKDMNVSDDVYYAQVAERNRKSRRETLEREAQEASDNAYAKSVRAVLES